MEQHSESASSPQTLEDRIQSDRKLKLLLIDQDITVLTSFKPADHGDEGLKNYIQDRYVASAKKIIRDNIGTETEGKIASLIRSMEVLATPQVELEIVAVLLPEIANALVIMEEIKHDLTLKVDYEIKTMMKIDKAISYWLIACFNQLTHHESIAKSKTKFIGLGLDICDIIKTAKAKEDTPKYALYNVIMNHFDKVQDMGAEKARFNALRQKLNKKRKAVEWKYILGVMGIILLYLLKLAIKLGR